jgi:hypothetical protein
MANFANNFYDVEWRVKGLWNAVLTQFWLPAPFNAGGWYLISPEAYPNPASTQDHRADLAINGVLAPAPGAVHATLSSPLLSFEAKGAADADTFADIMTQIHTWCNAAPQIIAGSPCWCIGAKGQNVKFWVYSVGPGNGTANAMIPVRVVLGNPVIDQTLGPNQAIELPWHDPRVVQILQFMFNHPFCVGLVGAGGGVY